MSENEFAAAAGHFANTSALLALILSLKKSGDLNTTAFRDALQFFSDVDRENGTLNEDHYNKMIGNFLAAAEGRF
jgi:hypothetical protein